VLAADVEHLDAELCWGQTDSDSDAEGED
jgi:hypothetical protein